VTNRRDYAGMNSAMGICTQKEITHHYTCRLHTRDYIVEMFAINNLMADAQEWHHS